MKDVPESQVKQWKIWLNCVDIKVPLQLFNITAMSVWIMATRGYLGANRGP